MSIPTLNWTRVSTGMIDDFVASVNDGHLIVHLRTNGLQSRWTLRHEPSEEFLGEFATDDDAKAYARTWVGDDEGVTPAP